MFQWYVHKILINVNDVVKSKYNILKIQEILYVLYLKKRMFIFRFYLKLPNKLLLMSS